MTTPDFDAFLSAVKSGDDELAEAAVHDLYLNGDSSLDHTTTICAGGRCGRFRLLRRRTNASALL